MISVIVRIFPTIGTQLGDFTAEPADDFCGFGDASWAAIPTATITIAQQGADSNRSWGKLRINDLF